MDKLFADINSFNSDQLQHAETVERTGAIGSTEITDPDNVFKTKIAKIKELVANAKYIVVYTGAGVSTAANIPDFRGDKGLNKKGILGLQEHLLDFIMPTLTHAAVAELVRNGKVKFVTTSNHDDLHYKSGVPPENTAELFGNAYIEKCLKCKTHYRRSVVVPNINRKCDNKACGGRLTKSGVRFGEAVPEIPLKRAMEQSTKADLALVFGSSMSVSPFCDLPPLATHYVICNLQPTPYDRKATVKINAKCDDVMREIMQSLNTPIPSLTFTQKFIFQFSKNSNEWSLNIAGGKTNEPVTCIQNVEVFLQDEVTQVANAEPDAFGKLQCTLGNLKNDDVINLCVVTNFREGCGSKKWAVKLEGEKADVEGDFTREAHYA